MNLEFGNGNDTMSCTHWLEVYDLKKQTTCKKNEDCLIDNFYYLNF